MSTSSDFFEIDEDCPLPKCSIILLLLLLSFLLLLLFLLYFKRKVLLKKFRIHPFPFQNRQGGGRKGVKAEGKKEEEGRWKIQKFKTPLKGERTQKPAKGLWMEGGKTEEKEKRGKEGGELGEEVKGKKEVERGRAMKMTSISEYLHNKESLISRVMDFEEVESFDTVYPAKKKDAARRRVNESGANLPTVTKKKISQDQYCLVQEKSEVVLKNRPRRSVSLNINENIEFLESTEKKTETNGGRRDEEKERKEGRESKNQAGREVKEGIEHGKQEGGGGKEGTKRENMEEEAKFSKTQQINIINMVHWEFTNVSLEIENV